MRHILLYRYRYLLLAFCLATCGCDKEPKTSAANVSAYNYSTDDIDRISLSGPDGTYERSSTPPADNDPYIVQGIPDDKLNSELVKEIAWYAKERANEERARKAAGTQKEGGQP